MVYCKTKTTQVTETMEDIPRETKNVISEFVVRTKDGMTSTKPLKYDDDNGKFVTNIMDCQATEGGYNSKIFGKRHTNVSKD